MYLFYVLYVSLFLFLFVLSSGSEGASLMRPSLLLYLVLRVETLSFLLFSFFWSFTSHTVCINVCNLEIWEEDRTIVSETSIGQMLKFRNPETSSALMVQCPPNTFHNVDRNYVLWLGSLQSDDWTSRRWIAYYSVYILAKWSIGLRFLQGSRRE